MQNKQQVISSTVDGSRWKETIIANQIVKSPDAQSLEFQPCRVTAGITEKGHLLFACDCEEGKKGKACEHILQAISGDRNLPADRYDKSQRHALIKIWNTAVETQIYETECNFYEKKQALTDNKKKIKLLREELPNKKSSDIEALEETISITSKQGIKIQNEIMKLAASRDHQYTSTGVPLRTHNKVKNMTRLLEVLTKGSSDRSMFLPLFLPEDIDSCNWFLYPCSAFAVPLGIVETERTKQLRDNNGKAHTKRYLVRTQSSNFSFAVGDIFYDTPIARDPNTSWGEALPNINTVVQVLSVKNKLDADSIVSVIEFSIWNPHTNQKTNKVMPVADFIRYLITGDSSEYLYWR